MKYLTNTCPICSVELQNVKTILRARRRDEACKPLGDINIKESWCPSCEIYLTRKIVYGEQDSGWKTSFVEEESLTRILDPEDLEKVLQDMELHPYENDELKIHEKEQLEKFLSMKKEQDEIHEYVLKEATHIIKGLTIKRAESLIGSFRYSIKSHSA